ncbi:MAG TPA: CHAD domain-containing protein, partial [Nitrososphaeraceae archaeon]|nr:CHAD domain-containing protein [Nitrososphaeraceae archaeon]
YMYLYYWFNKLSMKTYSISSKQMIIQVNNNFENFKNILNLYLKNPNDKNIHDLRKSIRRLDSAYFSLPKEFRKNKPIKNYVNHSKDLFKSNSQVRDYDIFLEKINSHNSTNNKNNNLKDQIEQNKKTQLETAKKIAQNLELYDFPQIGNALISDKKVQKRFNKVSDMFNDKIKKELDIVIQDKNKIKKLHELRKDCKKLRYLLELISDQDKDIEKTVKQLDDIQDILGEIHDCDATIMFLRQQKKQYPGVKNFINNESTIRNNKYEQFVNQYKNYTQPNISLL